MKTRFASLLLLLLSLLPVGAQEQVDAAAEERSDSVATTVAERGPHHRVVQKVSRQVTSFGREYFVTNSYTELATGMHYKKEGDERWHESRETIELFQNGAIAREGANQVIWSPNLNNEGAVDVLTSDGKRFRSHILGLAYTDAVSGRSVLIAEPKDCVGEVVGNQVFYRDAFDGPFRADVRYTYTRAGISQDILIREALPSAADYDLDPERSRIEVWTEFTMAPEPVKSLGVLKTESDPLARQVMVDPNLTDEMLDFGAMKIGTGSAFPLEAAPGDPFGETSAPVGKNWLKLEGRTFLIEKTDLRDIREQINALPQAAALNEPKRAQQMQAAVKAAKPRQQLLATLRGAVRQEARRDRGVMRMASMIPPEKGFVLDYSLSGSLTNFTFKSDTTYFVGGSVSLYGTTVLESAVIKYTNGQSNARLIVNGPLDCRTDSYRPAIFTGKDDNTVGEIISGSTGNPAASYYGYFFDISGNTNVIDLHDVQMRRGYYGVHMGSSPKLILRNAQMSGHNAAVAFPSGGARLRNVLIHDAFYAFGGSGTNISAENVTFHRLDSLRSSTGSSYNTFLTNSLVFGVTNRVSYMGANVVSNLYDTGIFQTVGAGTHYLAAGSTNRDAGTTNINPDLLVAMRKKTTYPPTVLTAIGQSTNLSTVVERDESQPDLGYHYEPLDYLVGGVTISNITVTVTNGAAIGIDASYTNYGIRLDSGASVTSEGSPVKLNRFVRNNAVQELGTNASLLAPIFADTVPRPASVTTVRGRFTEYPLITGSYLFNQEYGNGTLTTLALRDSQVWGGRLSLYPHASNIVVSLTNCLFDRVSLKIHEYTQGGNLAFNNLFRGGSNYLLTVTGSEWEWKDNLFDQTALSQFTYGAFTHDRNGYVNGYDRLTPTNNWDQVLAASPAYEIGWLGRYYLPTNSPLIDAGSQDADYVGFYHYTTATNQTKEGNGQVDIGFHYVAINSSGLPVDTDSDGLPDYMEDANGDGATDTGETCFHDPILTIASTLNYIKGSPPKLLDTNAVVIDSVSADFGGGRLTITALTNADPQERIAIRNQGTNANQIGVSGTNVTYAGTTIANFSGGTGTNALQVNFNTSATVARVQALLRNVTFHIASNNPPEGLHTLQFHLTDGDGGTNAPTYQTVNVVCPVAMDVMLVLDVSHSLDDINFTNAINAASNFVSFLDLERDRVGLISFAGFPVLRHALTTNGAAVQSTISGLTKTNGTLIAPPLYQAIDHLTNNARLDTLPLIVLLSDGIINASPVETNRQAARNEAASARDLGIRIVALGYPGDDSPEDIEAGLELMQELATTSLDYYFAPSSLQMQSNFTAIAQCLCRGFPPVVALTAPTNGSVFFAPAGITLEATASDSDGTVTKVEFFADGNEVGEDAAPPFTFNWSSVAAGVYAVTAVATDNTGITATSSVVNVIVDAPPTVTITAPTNGSIFVGPSSVTITANASDSDGTVSLVEFFNFGTNKLGEAASSPFTIVWQNPLLGTNLFTAVATDNYGARATSSVVNVIVHSPPLISIVNPTNSSEFASVMNLLVRASAVDADGVVTNVLFYTNNVAAVNVTNPPFQFAWTNLTGNVTNTVFAVAMDNHGNSATSTTNTFNVDACPQVGVSSLTFSTNTIAGGSSLTATVALFSAAPAGGQTVTLLCDNPNVSIPSSVLVPAGANTVTFQVDTFTVVDETYPAITASTPQEGDSSSFTIQAMGFLSTQTPAQCGPMDVAFVLDRSRSSWTGVGMSLNFEDGSNLPYDVKLAFTNMLRSIEFASGGDYRLGLVTFASNNVYSHLQLSQTNGDIFLESISTFEVIEETAPPPSNTPPHSANEPSIEALDVVINNLSSASRTNLHGDFTNHFRLEARKVILLVTDRGPMVSGENDVYYGTYDFLSAHQQAVNAVLKDIQICSVGMPYNDGSGNAYYNPDVFVAAEDYAFTTGGRFFAASLVGLNNSGFPPPVAPTNLSICLEGAMSLCGADLGEMITSRDDLRQWNHAAIVLNDQSKQTASLDSATFDLSGMDGAVMAAQFQRTGRLRINHGSHFSLDLGLASVTDANLAFFAPPALSAQVTALGASYTTNWNLPFRFFADIQQRLGSIYPVELVDRVSSICGNNFDVVDTPQSDWPTARNTLTLKTFAQFQIPQGRCRDFVLAGTNAPCTAVCYGPWEIRLYNEVIASACSPQGWSVESDDSVYGGVNICVPPDALTANRYEVRFLEGETARSGYFSVVPAGSLLTAPVLKPLEISLPTCSSNTLVTVTVSLDGPAQGEGAFVSLTASGITNQNIPAYVHIPHGQTSSSFTFRPSLVTEDTPFEITANYNGTRKAVGTVIAEPSTLDFHETVSVTSDSRRIVVSWERVPGALFYEVWRTSLMEDTSVVLAGRATGACVVDERPPNDENCYTVIAINTYTNKISQGDESCFTFSSAGVLRPRITPHGGRFNDSVYVAIRSETTNATIYWSTNGIQPSLTNGTNYASPIFLPHSAQVIARAYVGGTWSLDDRADFHISQPQPVDCGETIVSSLATTNQPSVAMGYPYYGARYSFNARRGDRVHISVLQEDFNARLILWDQNHVEVAHVTSRVGTHPFVEHTARTNGVYYVEVTSNFGGETGNFTISLDCPSSPELDVIYKNVELTNESTLDFGITTNNIVAKQTITLTNSGSADLVLGTLNISPGNLFSVDSPFTSLIPTNSSTNLTITFNSANGGPWSGTLWFENGDDFDDVPGDYEFDSPYVLYLEAFSNPPGVAPTVTITNLSDGQVLTTPPAVTIGAITNTVGGTSLVAQVSFHVSGPNGKSQIGVDTSGPEWTVNWNNAPGGTYVLTARATDSVGRVGVSAPITITNNNPPIAVNDRLAFHAGGDPVELDVLTNDSDPNGNAISIAGFVVHGTNGTLSISDGKVLYTPTNTFKHDYFTYTVADTHGATAIGAVSVAILPEFGQLPDPVAVIATPTNHTEILEPVAITGTASHEFLHFWELQYRRRGSAPSPWKTFAEGTDSVTNSTLGTFDPTGLPNGLYQIRLKVLDFTGVAVETNVNVRIGESAKIGHFTLSFTDLQIPVSGLPITLTRTYDSRNTDSGDFGAGWNLDVSSVHLEKSGIMGEGWGFQTNLVQLCAVEAEAHLVTITFPDDKVYRFAAAITLNGGDNSCTGVNGVSGAHGAITFYPLAGTVGTLTNLHAPAKLLLNYLSSEGSITFHDDDDDPDNQGIFGPIYDPQEFEFTTVDGRKFQFNAAGKVTKMFDRVGNSLTFDDNGITHTSGKSVKFIRDAAGRITEIYDPNGLNSSNQPSGPPALQYRYDAAGNLVNAHRLSTRNATNPAYLTTSFGYTNTKYPHYLTDITDPRGIRAIRNEYGDDGKLKSMTDASGKTINYVHSLSNRTEIIVDRMGRTNTFVYDNKGNVTEAVNPLGHTNRFSYDANGNQLTHTDPLGHTTTNTFDANDNLLSVTLPHKPGDSPDAFTTRFTYDEFGNQLTVMLPTGAVMSNTVDTTTGDLLAVRAGTNLITTFAYDANGNVTAEGDRFGTNGFAYDAFGNALRMTNTLDQVIQSDYDPNGNLTNLVDGGVTSRFEYDAMNREAFSDYGNGITLSNNFESHLDWTSVDAPTIGHMERRFDDQGRLAGWKTVNGATPGFAYNDNGQLEYETNSIGQVTRHFYDAAGRQTAVQNLTTGATSGSGYDAAGRRIAETNALGSFTLYTYNPDGSVATMTNAFLTNGWVYTYETGGGCCGGGGATTSVTDPLGRVMTSVASPYGLPVQTIRRASAGATGSNAATNSVTYLSGMVSPEQEAEDYPTAITDEGGRARNLEYNSGGQLFRATDLSGSAWWTNNFDATNGALTQIINPLGSNHLKYAYDALDNVKALIFADGGALTNHYDSANRLNGVRLPCSTLITNLFDGAGRLTNRQARLNGSVTENVGLSYNANDAVTIMTDNTGATTNVFDAAGRLIGIDYPTGASVRYGHDLLGRVTAITNKASAGGTAYVTRYVYDLLGQVTEVIDYWNRTNRFEYDRAGRRTKRTLANGVVSEWKYNWKDQVTNLTHKTSGGSTLASMAYERASGGEPSKITREDGSYVALKYDSTLRLTNEVYKTSGGSVVETIGYGYDLAGTRERLSNNAGTFTNAVTSGYRVEQVKNGATVVESYTYDTGGRITGMTRDTVTSSLGYNDADQLAAVTNGATWVTYTHDGQGRRTTATNSAGTVRRFLTAPTPGTDLESPHLVASGGGTLQQGYVFLGDEALLRFDAAGNPVYYLEDAMGSIVSLVSNNTSIATFSYDGVGNFRSVSGATNVPSGTGGDFRFHGAWFEADTGLLHMRAREYDQRTGRFLSRDPRHGVSAKPETLNPYSFALSNPHVFADPSGEFSVAEINISGAIQGGLQSGRSLVLSRVKSYALDKITQTFANVAVEQMENLFPGFGAFRALFKNGRFQAGVTLEEQLAGAICSHLPGSVKENLWLGPVVDRDGTPIADGFGCSKIDLVPSNGTGIGGQARPDFILSSLPPTETAKRGNRALLIGDIKLSGNSLYNQYVIGNKQTQFSAIANYAQKHTELRIALFLTVAKGDKEKLSAVSKKMAEAGLKNRTFFIVVSAF